MPQKSEKSVHQLKVNNGLNFYLLEKVTHVIPRQLFLDLVAHFRLDCQGF